MDTQATEVREVPKLGDAVKPPEIHTGGGTCSWPECELEADWVEWGGARVALPCSKHAAEEENRYEEEERDRLVSMFLPRAGITERLRHYSFETYREACGDEPGLASLAVVEGWTKKFLARERVPNLILYGEWGNGKTGLAIAAVREICEAGIEAKLVNFRELLDEMKDCIARKEPAVHAMGVHRVPVLVLDDLGSERPTPFACEQLLGIVNYRYEMQRPTIYISNFTPDELAKFLGAADPIIGHRIVSRMVDQALQHRVRAKNRRRPMAA